MAAMRPSNNRKLPPLPLPQQLSDTDPRHWAIVFTQARLHKRWTYLTLATRAGLSVPATVTACTKGTCNGRTALKLFAVLDLQLPTLPHILSAQEAHHGHA